MKKKHCRFFKIGFGKYRGILGMNYSIVKIAIEEGLLVSYINKESLDCYFSAIFYGTKEQTNNADMRWLAIDPDYIKTKPDSMAICNKYELWKMKKDRHHKEALEYIKEFEEKLKYENRN